MHNDEWRYEWIRTLVRGGIPVETAQAAYKKYFEGVKGSLSEQDPVLVARIYLSQQEPVMQEH